MTCENYKISVLINKVLLEYSHEDHMTYTEDKTRHLDLKKAPIILDPSLNAKGKNDQLPKGFAGVQGNTAKKLLTKKSKWTNKESDTSIMWDSLKFWNKSRFGKNIAKDKEII